MQLKRVLPPTAYDGCKSNGRSQTEGGNCHKADIDDMAFQPEQRRQDGQEQSRIDAEKQKLKDAVKGNKGRKVLIIPFGKLVPDNDHGYTPRKADQDQACHIFGIVVQE